MLLLVLKEYNRLCAKVMDIQQEIILSLSNHTLYLSGLSFEYLYSASHATGPAAFFNTMRTQVSAMPLDFQARLEDLLSCLDELL